MARRLAMLASVALLVLSVSACGGGGGGGNGGRNSPRDAAVGGIWTGTISTAGETADEAFGIIAEDGRAYFLDEWNLMYWGTVRSNGSSVSGSLTAADADGYLLWDESRYATVSLTGTVAPRQTLTGDWDLTTELDGFETGILAFDYDQLYEEDSSLQRIAGNYSDYYTGDVVNISGNGQIFSQSPYSSCVINGRVSIINAAYNAYDVQFTYEGCQPGDWYEGASFEGLAFLVPGDDVLIALTHRSNGDPEPLLIMLQPT